MTEQQITLNGEPVTQLPEVELNGQRVVMTPEVKEIYELINMANIARMRKLEESRVPASAHNITLNANNTIQHTQFAEPIIALSMENRGPGNFYYRINDGNLNVDPPLLINEVANINFGFPTIQSIYYRSDTTAIITILVKVGRKKL